MAEEEKIIERQTAKIASINEIITGKYIKKEGWEPNYVATKKNENISRVNIIGIVVTIPDNTNTLFLDDGTGKIEARSFENGNMFKDVNIGDVVLLIGRPREYNESIYINAEIVKKIKNKGWLEYRKKELILKNIKMPDIKTEEKKDEELQVSEEKENTANNKESIDEIEEILMKVKEMDKGDGCDVQELVGSNPKTEEIVEQLIMKGEIFEIKPGKVKIL
jgi:RPA family protein